MNHSLENICQQVQKNCHIADARHAGDFTMCTYLLKMREFFRWEEGFGIEEPLPKEQLGDWLEKREALWENLEDDYMAIDIDGKFLPPFEVEEINQALAPLGLVYAAGLSNGAKASFFLGELLHREQHAGFVLHVSGREYARCLSAPPAMSAMEKIFLRKESLSRYLWEKYESWGWNRADNALGRAFAQYDFENNAEAALAQMTEKEMAAVREHELGECEASKLLGKEWNEMLLDLALSPSELMARAVKDHLADSLRTLPLLIEKQDMASLHFYIGNLTGMRKHLFPKLLEAYEVLLQEDDFSVLEAIVAESRQHWLHLGQAMLEIHQRFGVGSAETVRRLVLTRCGREL